MRRGDGAVARDACAPLRTKIRTLGITIERSGWSADDHGGRAPAKVTRSSNGFSRVRRATLRPTAVT
jgi:hypothetical protein